MDSSIILIITAVLIPVIGWFVTAQLDKRKIDKLRKEAQARAYYEDQLKSLYGPIFVHQRESKAYFNSLLNRFGRSILIPSEGLSEEEIIVYNYYAENYFIPINRKIVEIILSNSHLLPSHKYPEGFTAFIEYACTWESAFKLNILSKTYEFIPPPANYPREFEIEIINQIEALKLKQWKIVNKMD